MSRVVRPITARDADTERYAHELRESLQTGRYAVEYLADPSGGRWYLTRVNGRD